jgi:hypothetical protein
MTHFTSTRADTCGSYCSSLSAARGLLHAEGRHCKQLIVLTEFKSQEAYASRAELMASICALWSATKVSHLPLMLLEDCLRGFTGWQGRCTIYDGSRICGVSRVISQAFWAADLRLLPVVKPESLSTHERASWERLWC